MNMFLFCFSLNVIGSNLLTFTISCKFLNIWSVLVWNSKVLIYIQVKMLLYHLTLFETDRAPYFGLPLEV